MMVRSQKNAAGNRESEGIGRDDVCILISQSSLARRFGFDLGLIGKACRYHWAGRVDACT
jgi:hypothetical protein